MHDEGSVMDDILMQKFIKEHEQRKAEEHRKLGEPNPSKRMTSLSPTPTSSSLKEEFLKSYLAQSGNTRYDRNLTVSWMNKHEEKRRLENFLANDSKIEKGRLSISGSPRGFLPLINKDEQHPLSPKIDKRITSEPVGVQDGKAVDPIKEIMLNNNKYTANSPRLSIHGTLPMTGNPSPEFLSTFYPGDDHVVRSGFNNSPQPSLFGEKKLQQKSNVRKGLEEIFQRDFTKDVKGHQKKLSLITSPYSKNHVKTPKEKMKSLNRSDRSIAGDMVLMGKFVNPYASHLPFEKPINASVKNSENTRLKELEIKTQILRNIRSIEQSFVSDISIKEEKREPSLSNLSSTKVSPKETKTDFLKSYAPGSKSNFGKTFTVKRRSPIGSGKFMGI